jgi:hypothetical protein
MEPKSVFFILAGNSPMQPLALFGAFNIAIVSLSKGKLVHLHVVFCFLGKTGKYTRIRPF